MVGTEKAFASTSLRRWHSICTHHLLTTIPSSVYQHPHGHDGNTFLTKHWLTVSLCFASVWRYSSHLFPQHRQEIFLWVWSRRQLASVKGMQDPRLGIDYSGNVQLSFILPICGSLRITLHGVLSPTGPCEFLSFASILTFLKLLEITIKMYGIVLL